MSIRENLVKKAVEADVESTLAHYRMRDAYRGLTEQERRRAKLEASEQVLAIISKSITDAREAG
jgi:hypothetical protein